MKNASTAGVLVEVRDAAGAVERLQDRAKESMRNSAIVHPYGSVQRKDCLTQIRELEDRIRTLGTLFDLARALGIPADHLTTACIGSREDFWALHDEYIGAETEEVTK